MGFDFEGKRVVVAGGSRGIGRSVALGFAGAGAAVSVCARNVQGLKAVEVAGRLWPSRSYRIVRSGGR